MAYRDSLWLLVAAFRTKITGDPLTAARTIPCGGRFGLFTAAVRTELAGDTRAAARTIPYDGRFGFFAAAVRTEFAGDTRTTALTVPSRYVRCLMHYIAHLLCDG